MMIHSMTEIVIRHICVKTPYCDQQTARRHAVHARKDHKPRLSHKEPYLCEICQLWHLRVRNERDAIKG